MCLSDIYLKKILIKAFLVMKKKVSKTQDTEAKHSKYTRKKSSQYLEMKSAFAFLNKQKDFFLFKLTPDLL